MNRILAGLAATLRIDKRGMFGSAAALAYANPDLPLSAGAASAMARFMTKAR